MRVLIVNTSEKTGGAAVAANRLMDALNNNGVKAKMLVRDKETEDITVVSLPRSLRLQWNFLWERWCVFWHLHFSRQRLCLILRTEHVGIYRIRDVGDALPYEETATLCLFFEPTATGDEGDGAAMVEFLLTAEYLC
jgi:hypothetical protein